MIELVATSASRSLMSRLPESPAEATVHSVFAHAVNLRWGETGWCSWLGPPLALNPWAILLPRLPEVETGERILVSRGEICSPAREIQIHLGQARKRDLRMQPCVSYDRNHLRARGEELQKWARTRPIPPSLLQPVLAQRGWERDPFVVHGVRAIEAARRSGEPVEAARHLLSLVGLGRGLTPAGDDFLAGFLAASACFDSADAGREYLVGTLPDRVRDRTTAVSRPMLEAACRGEFAVPILHLVKALVRTGNGVHRAGEDLLGVGASSGADLLAGLLFGLDMITEG